MSDRPSAGNDRRPGITRVLDRVLRRRSDGATRSRSRPLSVPLIATRGTVEAVTLEIGRGEALIFAAAHVDGRLRLAFGSGEEFAGTTKDLPIGVAAAARDVLLAATPVVKRMPRAGTDPWAGRGAVRITVQTSKGRFADEAGVAELESGRSALAPLWRACSELLGPLLTVLFDTESPGARRRDPIPGLERARSLWSRTDDSDRRK